MDYWFDIGDAFVDDFDDLEWEIVRIDYEDDEYPYECWPVDIINQAKKMAEDGGFTDEDGEFWEVDDYKDVLCDYFVDERMCCSNYGIKEHQHRQLQKENRKLKAEIKKLKAEIKKLKGEK